MKQSTTNAEIELLFVDDEPEFRSTAARHFRKRGYRVEEAATGEEGLRLTKQRAFHVAAVDMMMPGISGLEMLEKLKGDSADCEVILLTGEGTIETAVKAMKLGARDFLTKPAKLSELEVVIQKAFEAGQLQKENVQLRAVIERSRQPSTMIGKSPTMQEVFRMIERAGPTDKPILIQGDSGTGKELVAQALHEASHVANKPMVVINCAALPEHLLESELFGHEKGSFTGAEATKLGLFEVADGATLFIDEIGELAGPLQAKLLRVLEDGSMRRVGSTKERRVKVRLLSATNRDMAEAVKAGRFREDLYYRIDVMTLKLPPLRERIGDIPLLANHFAGPEWHIEPEAMKAIERYNWPGNVRQLINAIERAKILADDEFIRLVNLPKVVADSVSDPAYPAADSTTDLATLQKAHIADVMNREKGNKARTARALGLNRRTLYRLLEKYGLDGPK